MVGLIKMPVATVTKRSSVILCKVYILSPEISGLVADCMAFGETINYMAFFSWRVFFFTLVLLLCTDVCHSKVLAGSPQ